MSTYREFRAASDRSFCEKSVFPTQESHLIYMNWQSETFWEALGNNIAVMDRSDKRFPGERSEFKIDRDRHLQAILDVLPELPVAQQSILLDRSMQMCIDYKLLDAADEYFSFPIARILSDMGAGGITTLINWASAMVRVSPHSIAQGENTDQDMRAIWLACQIGKHPQDEIPANDIALLEKSAWITLIQAVSLDRQGLSIDSQICALESLSSIDQLKGFSGWPMLQIIGDRTAGIMDCVEHQVSCQKHPFDNHDLNVGTLVWESTSQGVLSPEQWSVLLEYELKDLRHFARRCAQKNSWNTAPRLLGVLRQFVATHQEVFLALDLSLQEFKNLESLGMGRDVLIKHPQASQAYTEALFSRDLGL